MRPGNGLSTPPDEIGTRRPAAILVELGRRRVVGGREDMIADVAPDLGKAAARRNLIKRWKIYYGHRWR
ncbi:MAG TPA: hypothetical protein VHZ32_04260 [Rhizomicrobium sp.]|nr:hypothetical protein [Rhizomicrobium sp.]